MRLRSHVGEAGFTLIEVVIALALFALISLAGLALVESVIRVEERTSGRLERLGQLQRAMFVLTRDLEQVAAGTLQEVNGGVRFQRNAASVYQPGSTVGYTLSAEGLFRTSAAETPAATAQLVLGNVASVSWSFFFRGRGWLENIPLNAAGAPEQPAAVAVDILLDESGAPSGSLRRVVELPAPLPERPS